MKKRLLSMMLMLAMVATLVPVFSMGVAASQPELNVVGAEARMRTLGLTMSNFTTAEDIMEAVYGEVGAYGDLNHDTALGLPLNVADPLAAGLFPGQGAAPFWVVPFALEPATPFETGRITGTIRLTWFASPVSFTFDVVINRTIPALTDYQGILDAAVAAAQMRVLSIPVNNQTTPVDILTMAASGLPGGATAAWCVDDPFAIDYAVVGIDGSITGTIVLTIESGVTTTGNTYHARFEVDRLIVRLTDFQAIVNGQAAVALARVEALRSLVNNNTAADIIMGVASDSLLAGIDADWYVPFYLVPATELGSGSITGTIRLTLVNIDGVVTADVIVNLPILPLGQRHALHWNHITETLSVAEGGLLYAFVRLRANQTIDDVDWTRVRWFPLEGELNLGRMIPRRHDRTATIAIRDADDARFMTLATPTNMTTGVWMPGIRDQGDARLITIQGRTALARNSIVWSAAANGGHGGLVIGGGTLECAFSTGRNFAFLAGRAGVNGWTVASRRTQAYFPMGSPLEIREIATPTTLSGIIAMDVDTIVPATTSLRIRVPAIPAAPRINALPETATDATPIRGVRANAQIAILPASELGGVSYGAALPGGRTWVEAPGANPTAAAARQQVSGDANVNNTGEGDVMLVRLVDANGRRPNSFYTVVNLPAPTPPAAGGDDPTP